MEYSLSFLNYERKEGAVAATNVSVVLFIPAGCKSLITALCVCELHINIKDK